MFANYFKVAIRALYRNLQINVINILGLAFSLACCTLCYLHIQYETAFDKFHKNGSRIYRLVTGNYEQPDHWVKVSVPIPPVLKQNVPEIEKFARFNSVSYAPQVVVQQGDKTYNESFFMMADPAFLEMFSFPTLKGVKSSDALKDPSSIVITERIAKKLFGDDDPIGKTITMKDQSMDFQVTAILQDIPTQSHLHFDYLVSFENVERFMGKGISQSWGAYNFFSYIQLTEHADVKAAQQKIQQVSASTPKGDAVSLVDLHLQPLHDIHFRYNRGNLRPSYDIKYIYIFSSIALALLLIACINYINLAITMAIKRVKEIGVRKAVGAGKLQLTFQFMNEAFLITSIALVLSLMFMFILLPFWNSLMDSQIALDYTNLSFVGYLVLISSIVVIISGSYLAFYANSYKTASILKGISNTQPGSFSLQNSLLMVQFSIAMILITCAVIIANQLTMIRNKNLGMNYQQVVNIPLSASADVSRINALKNELKKSTDVIDASASSFVPGRANWNQSIWWEGQVEPVSWDVLVVDKDFIKTMQIQLHEGNIDEITRNESGTQYLINETGLSIIGWQSGLGHMISPFGENEKKPVTAVVKDFHYKSLHHGLDPLIIVVTDERKHSLMAIRISGNDISSSIKYIETSFKNIFSDLPFEYTFMDEKFDQLYKSETRLGTLIWYLTVLSIVMSFVGLYGLLSFNIQNRSKEIAVRKVLGVSFGGLLILFSKRYFALLLIAGLMAIPVTVYLMSNWLNNFQYRIAIQPVWFALTFVLIFGVLTGIILLRSLMFSSINPATALKYE